MTLFSKKIEKLDISLCLKPAKGEFLKASRNDQLTVFTSLNECMVSLPNLEEILPIFEPNCLITTSKCEVWV